MFKLEYIWIDGTEPTAQLRSKTKVVEDFGHNISSCPEWNFDGSSTNQADGHDSDCVLKPVRLYENPMERHESYLVLCEVWDVDGNPHQTNKRWNLDVIQSDNSKDDVWVGIEQEYTLYENGFPLGWPEDGSEPPPQGDYYCGRNIGDKVSREH